MGKGADTQCYEMTVLTDSFVPLHALLFWLRNEVVYQRFIMNNVLRYKFLLGNVGIIREVLQKLVLSSGVSISTPIWQTLCSYAEMHKIFIAQKSYCACRVLSTATIRSKYYFNFILIRTRSGRELFDRPSYLTLNMTLLAACCARLLHVTRDSNCLTEDNATHTSGPTGLHDFSQKNGFIIAHMRECSARKERQTEDKSFNWKLVGIK